MLSRRAPRATCAAALILALASTSPAAGFDHAHAPWTAVLAAHVRDGRVDYAALRKEPAPLAAYLSVLEAVTPAEYRSFSRAERLAFWINAYNAYAIRLVVDRGPVASIRKIGRLWESPFRIEFIPLPALGGGKISLDTIENEVLRKELADPRIHAAIVCAARSCPKLSSRAYTAAGIEGELDRAMTGFLADPDRNRWDPARRKLYLSSIFKWFAADFEKARGSLLAFVVAHAPAELARQIGAEPAPEIEFLDYDWSLNGL